MPWCPKCKAEYRDGFNVCSECNVELVQELPPVKPVIESYDKEAFLTSAANEFEAQLIEGLLNSENIPVMKKAREAGGYLEVYMGTTIYGIDLYVPEGLLEKAKEIINSKAEITEEEVNDTEDLQKEEQSFLTNRRIGTWVIILIFVPGLLWIALQILIFVILKVLKH